MRIIFMGTPKFAVPILKALNERYTIVGVVSQPNRERKRGKLLMTPVCETATELGLPVYQPEKLMDIYEALVELKADIMITAAYGQFVPTKILNLFQKCINVHGSLLPKYRGGAPIQRAILNGDKKTGITIMEMVKGMDAGVMYAKKECPILEEDTSSVLFEKLSYLGKDLLLETLEDIVNGKIKGEPQREDEVTFAPNLKAFEEIVNFNMPAFLVVRHIHSMAEEPGAVIHFKDASIKVFDATVVKDTSNALPGTVLSLKKQVLIKTLDDAVSLDRILVPGKKILSAKDFVNGQKILKELDVIS